MKILHICLSSFYIDGAGYQENLLVKQHVDMGHEVFVLASTEIFDGAGGLTYTEPQDYMGQDGARVLRVPYVQWLPQKIAKKLRIHPNIYNIVHGFSPDSILFHGCAGNEIVNVAKYANNNPDVLFYVDSHEDYNNSARNFVSEYFLHKIFYRNRVQKSLKHIKKVLCISTESVEFTREAYGIPSEKQEFYPLGGFPLKWEEIGNRRKTMRDKHGFSDDDLIFIQSGKITGRKKLAQSLRAFKQVEADGVRFLIAGLLTDEVRVEVEELIDQDPRVMFLGWKSPAELTNYLCAADVYVQPGTQSATMQNALCCACHVVIDGVPAHQAYLSASPTLLESDTDLVKVFNNFACEGVKAEQKLALEFAFEHLDYRVLAQRILS